VNSKNLLMVGNFLPAGQGSHTTCLELARRFEDLGWQVLRTSSRRSRPLRLLDMTSTAWRQRKTYQAAHVEVYSGLSFIWAEAAAWVLRRAGKPFVLALHGGSLPTFAQDHPTRVRRLLRSANVVCAPSQYLQRGLSAYRADIRLLPNGIDLSRYAFRLRAQPKPALVWLRAFHAIYNPALAVEVLSGLRRQFPAAHLAMIGPDKGDGSLQQAQALAQAYGLQNAILFAGPVPNSEVPTWLDQGDIFINTTNIDNTPVSVIEALACGLPVVSTNVGGLPDLLHDGADSLLVNAGNTAVMTEAVLRILQEDGLAEKLSSQARRSAEQFDWKTILPQWEALFEEILQPYGT
jgi:glycosyltransferase involved in cell wall biosynthesis